MRKALSILGVFVLVCITCSAVMAVDLTHKVGLGLNLGMEKYRGEDTYNENSKFDFAREVYLKYGLSSNVSAIFNYGLQDLKYGPKGKDGDDGSSFTTEVDPYIEFKLQFCAFPEKRLTPFGFVGGGILNFNPKDADGNKLPVSKNDTWGDWKGMALLGAGAEFFITDWLAVNGHLDWHLPFTDQLDALAAGDWDDGYWGGKVGLTLYTGMLAKTDRKVDVVSMDQFNMAMSSLEKRLESSPKLEVVTSDQLKSMCDDLAKKLEDISKTRPCDMPRTLVMPEKVGESVCLRGVNFETNSDILTPTSHAILDEAVQMLKDRPEIEVEIQGHTDSRGSDAYNQRLSERRADSVRRYLVSKGIEACRLRAVGYGEKRPIASNETAEGMAENRRVELLRLK